MRDLIRINPEWQMARFAYAIVVDGKVLDPHTVRWASCEDADHDFDRLERGLPPERNVPMTIGSKEEQ